MINAHLLGYGACADEIKFAHAESLHENSLTHQYTILSIIIEQNNHRDTIQEINVSLKQKPSTAKSNDSECKCECSFHKMIETVKALRAPGGCPWDTEQTHSSLRPNLLEEAYETLDAIDSGEPSMLEEELGDLMIQIAFHADIANAKQEFNADSICDKVTDKLQRRHPHVFGDADKLDNSEDVVDRWEILKRQEAGGYRSIIASVPKSLPALAQSAIIQRRAIRAGLKIGQESDMPPVFQSRQDNESDDEAEIRAGEFLMAIVRQMQSDGIDPEIALRKSNISLLNRILRAEKLAGQTALADLTDEEREQIWSQAA